MSYTNSFNDATRFYPELETIVEFLERFKVQCADLLKKADSDDTQKVSLLMKALPVSIITDLQRRIKPTRLSEATYEDICEKLTTQNSEKMSVVGVAVQFMNRKQGNEEPIETYAKVLSDLASECNFGNCCRDRLLRDAFISGLQSRAILSSLLQECETKKISSFDDCVERAQILDQMKFDAQNIRHDNEGGSNFLRLMIRKITLYITITTQCPKPTHRGVAKGSGVTQGASPSPHPPLGPNVDKKPR